MQNESENWHATEAVVASSNVRRDWNKSNGTPKTIYWFELQYNYKVRDIYYLAERHVFHDNPSFSHKTGAEKLLKEFPVGKSITIYFQPDDPKESVVKR